MSNAPTNASLLEQVEKFLVRENLSATQFGALVMGDTKFVNTLRKGRRVREATTLRVRAWMASQAGAK